MDSRKSSASQEKAGGRWEAIHCSTVASLTLLWEGRLMGKVLNQWTSQVWGEMSIPRQLGENRKNFWQFCLLREHIKLIILRTAEQKKACFVSEELVNWLTVSLSQAGCTLSLLSQCPQFNPRLRAQRPLCLAWNLIVLATRRTDCWGLHFTSLTQHNPQSLPLSFPFPKGLYYTPRSVHTPYPSACLHTLLTQPLSGRHKGLCVEFPQGLLIV